MRYYRSSFVIILGIFLIIF